MTKGPFFNEPVAVHYEAWFETPERRRANELENAVLARRHAIVRVLNRWSVLGLPRRLAGLLRPTVYDAAHSCGVAELKRLQRSVIGGKGHVVWRTTLCPRGWPWMQASLPWRGFIGMGLIVTEELK